MAFKSLEELTAKAETVQDRPRRRPARKSASEKEENMPTAETAVTDAPTPAAPVVSDTISISREELTALVASAAQAAVQAATQSKNDGSVIGEAFAKSIAPVLETLSANQKQVVDTVLDKTGRNVNDMASYPAISVFNPKGDRDNPRPKLVDKNGKYRQTLFCGCDMGDHIERMTNEEIEALNAIDTDCEARDGQWTAHVRKNGTTEVLEIRLTTSGVGLPKDDDRRRDLPGLVDICYELKRGKRMPDVNSLLSKMYAQAPDPDAFIANLTKLLGQANQ